MEYGIVIAGGLQWKMNGMSLQSFDFCSKQVPTWNYVNINNHHFCISVKGTGLSLNLFMRTLLT